MAFTIQFTTSSLVDHVTKFTRLSDESPDLLPYFDLPACARPQPVPAGVTKCACVQVEVVPVSEHPSRPPQLGLGLVPQDPPVRLQPAQDRVVPPAGRETQHSNTTTQNSGTVSPAVQCEVNLAVCWS